MGKYAHAHTHTHAHAHTLTYTHTHTLHLTISVTRTHIGSAPRQRCDDRYARSLPNLSGHNTQSFVTQYTQDPPSVTLWTTTNIIAFERSRPTLQPTIMDDPALRCSQRLWTIPPYAATHD